MKHRISVTVDKENYQLLNSFGINISGLVNEAIRKEAHKLKSKQWKADNREGMEEVANFIAQYGSFAEENRNWWYAIHCLWI
ncbi:type II toxin-antitoxin system antitoxin CcdA (plasmid) [Providencia rettgeri]|uniref:Type II toxin-antitoxin system antitoxin CcdA n=2 Tax=Morganellaceae TaxID=1903414 RepID=A0AAJ6K4A6_PRORE|nr:type II toxin-antitoxin system antitoxin CcdA [Providencia rettgeri]WHT81650.1 type II toxin-antitoxin system antitoxin CcdA [Providencia rettgeri]WHT95730.1 type II toxin-antitoxin system antitoxin CcdA [Providencia rettgeri]WJM88381.1 type II toxin-antitoxin system antitoxin CcdA [Providencia rettgeri]